MSGMKHWGMSPTSIRICLQTRDAHRNRNTPYDYTYTGSSGKQKVTIELSQILRKLLIEFHVIYKGCQMAWSQRHTIAMDRLHAGSQKNESDTLRSNTGGVVAKGCPQRGTLTHSDEAWLKTNSQSDSMGMAVIHWDKCYPHQWKIPKLCFTSSSGGFEYGTTVLW